MKKGLDYVDWAMSVGIFIIYIILLFTVFKPQLQKDYSEDFLLNIVENNIKENLYDNLEKYPLFIELTGTPEGNYLIKIPDLPPNSKWQVENTTVINPNFEFLKTQVIEGISINFDSSLTSPGKNTFYILHSNKIKFHTDIPSNPNLLNDPDTQFDYQIGVGELIYGLSYNKTESLEPDYEKLKEQWNFPSQRDFSIKVYNFSSIYPMIDYTHVNPPKEKNIYVRQWSTWLLNNNSIQTPVWINIQVW